MAGRRPPTAGRWGGAGAGPELRLRDQPNPWSAPWWFATGDPRPGGPLGRRAHAEVTALREAGDAARGATLVVSSNPAATRPDPPAPRRWWPPASLAASPPCSIPTTGERRGLVSLRRPASRLPSGGGRGGTAAQRAVPPLGDAGLPFVTAKFASSLDGRIATAAASPAGSPVTPPATSPSAPASTRRRPGRVGTVLATTRSCRPGSRERGRQPLRVWSTAGSRSRRSRA